MAARTPCDAGPAAFTDRFGGEPAVLGCAPGRVELLGNHTDYNGGLVMAAAIDRSTIVVGRRSSRQRSQGRLGQLRPVRHLLARWRSSRTEAGAWTRYVRGVCWALAEWRGPTRVGLRGGRSPAMFPSGPASPARQASRPSVAWFLIQLGLRSRPIEPRLQRPIRTTCSAWSWPRHCGGPKTSSSESARACSTSFPASSAAPTHALFLDCDTLDP